MFKKKLKAIMVYLRAKIKMIWDHDKTRVVRGRLGKNPRVARVVAWSKGNKRALRLFLVIIALLIIVANFIFPLKNKFKAPDQIVRADIFSVKKVDFVDELAVTGLVRGAHNADLAFQVNGILKEIKIKEAQTVKKGDVIAVLDDSDARLKVEYNQSKVLAAQKKYEVHKQLFELKSIIEAKYEEVLYEYRSQEKELEFARAELEKTKLYSPLDGMVGPFEVDEGEAVTPHTKVVSVFSLGFIYVDAGIIEKDISKIKLDAGAKIMVDAYPGSERLGKVILISPVVEGKSRNFRVRIEAANDDPSHIFLPGMFARARVEVFHKLDAIVVPMSSVKDDMVYVVKDGRAYKQAVKVGYKSYDYIEVLEGLTGDEQILAEVESDFDSEVKVEVVNKREYVSEGK
jgi:membrane fusion protein (multidrug efflux system)